MEQNGSVERQVVRRLGEYIRTEHLKEGDRLPTIRQLSDMWDLGRNLVRDGVLRAQQLGLVRVQPRLGMFVQRPDFSPMMDALEDALDIALMEDDVNLLQIIEARLLVETKTVAEAAVVRRPKDMLHLREALETMQEFMDDRVRWVEADEKFHLRIAKIADNTVLTTFLKVLLALQRPHRYTMLWTNNIREDTVKMHEDIYRRIVEGNTEAAKTAMIQHLESNRGAVLDTIATVPGHRTTVECESAARSSHQTVL